MVSLVDDFDVIIAASEFEALVLECSLIKRHSPKYNILLKDDKGYPYVRLSSKDAYPELSMANKISDDGAEYFGPFGSRGVTQDILESIRHIFHLPSCSKRFPRDIGKGRVCLHYHMNQCDGWCQKTDCHEEFRGQMMQVRELLCGNFNKVAEEIKKEMLSSSEDLNFEQAAQLRDRYKAILSLGQKQLVTAGKPADTDVVGYAETETKACFTVLHFNHGNLLDKDYQIFALPDDKEDALSTLLNQYYQSRGYAPKRILLPFSLEDQSVIAEFISRENGKKVELIVPKRGENVKLIELAVKNAQEEAIRITDREERAKGAVMLLGKMLTIEAPNRIESFDISHIAGTDIVASMVVFLDGKPKRSEYKRFKLENMDEQDDYGAMKQVLQRRFQHYVQGDKGFACAPDLLLIDGGQNHAAVAQEVLEAFSLDFPVFGMVKDDRHRTRALITAAGQEIRIDSNQSIFSFIGNIQEETHRFAITFHRSLRSKRLRHSQLDGIDGVGPKRKQDLIKHFHRLKLFHQQA
jgi:excinuclease ABC subunit C